MMKIVGLVLGITILLAGMAVAEPVTFDVYQGWNLLALPQAPTLPAVQDVFKTAGGASVPVISKLSTYDMVGGSGFPYDNETKDFFGGMLLGQGYWLWCDEDQWTIQYDAFPNGLSADGGTTKTDMWISLPGFDSDGDSTADSGGWAMIGNPYNQLVDIGAGGVNIKFTDGTTVKTWAEASTGPGAWVDATMTGNIGGSGVPTGFATDGSQLNFLIPAAGYWVYTNVPNLAMIIDGNKIATP